jgi:hypothetical protein
MTIPDLFDCLVVALLVGLHLETALRSGCSSEDILVQRGKALLSSLASLACRRTRTARTKGSKRLQAPAVPIYAV